MTLTIARDVPQVIVAVLNKVNWAVIPHRHQELAGKLSETAFGTLGIPKKGGAVSGASTGPKKINSDVPQCVLDVINEAAWSSISPTLQTQYAKRLTVAITLLGLPKRK